MDTIRETTDRIRAAVSDWRLDSVRQASTYAGATVRVSQAATTYTFAKNKADGSWRLTYVNTYGNTQGVYGPGCDASGFVIKDAAVIARLELLLSRAA